MDDHAEHAGLIASIRLLQDDVERHRRRTRWAITVLGAAYSPTGSARARSSSSATTARPRA